MFPVMLGSVDAKAITSRTTDIAGRMGVPSCRAAWGPNQLLEIELPLAERQLLKYEHLKVNSNAKIPWLLGATRDNALVTDLATAPHMLVTGTSGAGKSNATTASLLHLVESRGPQEVRLLIADLKEVDLAPFRAVPHTLSHETKPLAILDQSRQLELEMAKRYSELARVGAKNLVSYNHKSGNKLPYIVFIIDELGGLMNKDDRIEAEDGTKTAYSKLLTASLQNLLSLARASGIHLVLGMQRPGASSIDPQLRENLKARVAFKCTDASSSQLAVGDNSATGLLGRGDGLFKLDDAPQRFQAPFVDEETLHKVLAKAAKQKDEGYELPHLGKPQQEMKPNYEGQDKLQASIDEVRRHKHVNSRTLIEAGICGRSTAAKLLLQELESRGIVGPNDPSLKARPVLVSATDSDGW